MLLFQLFIINIEACKNEKLFSRKYLLKYKNGFVLYLYQTKCLFLNDY